MKGEEFLTLTHACAGVVFYPSLCLQLRSAGAAVIQELFPRVVSIATLDLSDNGKRHRYSHPNL